MLSGQLEDAALAMEGPEVVRGGQIEENVASLMELATELGRHLPLCFPIKLGRRQTYLAE